MTATAIPIESDAQWRELRRHNLNASEIPALFGEHAQLTPFELFHMKRGELPEPDLNDVPRVQWGKFLESAIIHGVSYFTGWETCKNNDYYSLPDVRIGGTPDAFVWNRENGKGVLEIKTADWLIAKKWGDEPPTNYLLQTQTYMELTGLEWAMVAVLVGGNDLRTFTYERRPRTMEIIKDKVSEFWKSIESNTPPKPDFGADHDAISRLYGSVESGKVVDLSGSNRLPELIGEYALASDQKRQSEKAAQAAKAEILSLLGDAEIAVCGKYQIRAGLVSGVPDRIIAEKDIGQTIKGRSGYRGLWIKLRTEAGEEVNE